jgi:hypothetical protein
VARVSSRRSRTAVVAFTVARAPGPGHRKGLNGPGLRQGFYTAARPVRTTTSACCSLGIWSGSEQGPKPLKRSFLLDAAFAAISREGPNALLVLTDRVFLHHRDRIAAFASEKRLPMMSAYRELAEAGGLMSFGPNFTVMHKQAVRFVDKILKGAKPAELPVEQPAKFEFVINLKSAKAVGVAVSPTLLALADEVIE